LYKSYLKAVSILSIITGILVITGWFTGNENLKSVITGLPTMKFNTAICFILSATALFLLTKKTKKNQFAITCISIIVILIAAITFTQAVFNYNTGLDELLIKDVVAKAANDLFPGRMATTTTCCFMLCAFAFITISSGKKKLQLSAQYALHAITIIAFIAIIGYLFNVSEFHRLSFLTSMALNTSVLFFLISIAASLINYSLGVTGMFTGKSVGSIVARKLFPLTALVIIILGYLRLQLHWHNLVTEDFGIALFATSFLLVSLVVTSLTSKYLNAIEEKRSRAEEELKILAKTESEQKLLLALASLGDNVWEHDFITQKTIFTNTNQNLAAFRNDGIQNIEQLWWNSSLTEDWYLLEENDRKYKAGIIDRHALEYRLIHKDGTIKWVLDRGIVIEKDSTGKPLKIIGTHTDITDRKNAEADLSKMQKQFQSFMEHIPAMAWIVDKESVYQFANTNYLNTFYKDAELVENQQLVGKSFYELFPHEIAEEYKRNNDIVFATNKILETIEPSVNKDGSNITLKVFKFPLQISDAVTLLGGIAIDITELIKAEENLKVLNEQLTTSNKELEQFAYIASHDLQEPLRMVSSFMQLLNKKYKPQLDETAKQYIDFAVDGAERMKALIIDLLSFSRIGIEKQINDTVNLNIIIDEVKLNLAASITESNAKIKAGTFPVIQANKIQMLQLFQNLISNAIKYRSERTPEIEIGYNEESTHYIFYVKDNGIGIDSNYFDKIFIIFQRLHNKTAYPGTGVGLSICKKIVEKHGGKFTVESEPGAGSIFNFSIPKKQKS
jgi:PAS domain S-box-containing protein